MVSSASNDLVRNKLSLIWIRGAVVLIIFPVVVVALKSPDILQIYLISDLVSAALVPVLLIGLFDRCYWWRGCEVVVGGLGGIFTIFLFGLVYYDGDAQMAGNLLLLENGLYSDDWSAFGAFVAAPVGALLWGFGAFAIRITTQYCLAKFKGRRFDAFDKPAAVPASFYTAEAADEDGSTMQEQHAAGKFF